MTNLPLIHEKLMNQENYSDPGPQPTPQPEPQPTTSPEIEPTIPPDAPIPNII